MPIDTSMYNTRPPEPVNPLALVQGYATAAHTLGENKLQQQQIRGRQALGQIISETMNPDGTPNPPAILAKAAKNPDAAWMVLQIQDEAKNANPLTQYMGTNAQGQPTPAQAPYYQVAGMNNPNWRAPQQNNPLMGGNEQPMPQLSQEKIDKLHAHNRAMISTLEPLVNDPELDHKKVIRTVSDLVANPDTDFNAMDGATALSGMPYGPDGSPPKPGQIQEKLAGILQQQKQHEAMLNERYPSSEMLKARQPSPVEISGPGVATGLPAGYTSPLPKSRETYNQVVDEAETVPQRVYAYNEILNLANSGAESGTIFADMVKKAARLPGWTLPEGTTDKAAQSQELSKFMSQALLGNGMPASDSRLQELQSGNLNPEQLIETVKKLAPAFKAVAKGAVEKQKYYNRETQNGANLTNEPEIAQTWNDNFDPRWIEYADHKDGAEKKKFLAEHPDMIEAVDKLRNLKRMGVIGKNE